MTTTPEEKREKSREFIAKVLISLVVAIILAALCSLWFGLAPIDDLVKILTIVFNPIVTMAGTVLGFYFGTRSQS